MRLVLSRREGEGIGDFGLWIADLGRHRAWGMEHRESSQNSEFRRKAIKIEFLSTTCYWLLNS
jgi:hypothetical protein